MNTYELALVLPGKTTPAKKKKELENLEKLVKLLEGRVVSVEEWGIKDLAYPIQKNTTGLFLIFTLELEAKAAKELLLKLKLEEQYLRYLLIKKSHKS